MHLNDLNMSDKELRYIPTYLFEMFPVDLGIWEGHENDLNEANDAQNPRYTSCRYVGTYIGSR